MTYSFRHLQQPTGSFSFLVSFHLKKQTFFGGIAEKLKIC